MKKKTLSMAILSIVLISAMVNVGSPDEIAYIDIDAEEAAQLLIRSQDVTILDVRTRAEYESGHIAGAISIPLSELEGRINELDRDGAIIVYCKSGVRSEDASNVLVNQRFRNAYNMLGGINTWIDTGFPLVQDSDPQAVSTHNLVPEIDGGLDSNKLVFLFFYAEWCHFCEEEKPIIAELEKEYDDKIVFIRLNGEEHQEIVKEFGASGYPSMFLITSKGEDWQYEYQYLGGFKDKETLKESIDRIINITDSCDCNFLTVSTSSSDDPGCCKCSGKPNYCATVPDESTCITHCKVKFDTTMEIFVPGETCCWNTYCANLMTDPENCVICSNVCPPDGWYCNGDVVELRDYYCLGECLYNVIDSHNEYEILSFSGPTAIYPEGYPDYTAWDYAPGAPFLAETFCYERSHSVSVGISGGLEYLEAHFEVESGESVEYCIEKGYTGVNIPCGKRSRIRYGPEFHETTGTLRKWSCDGTGPSPVIYYEDGDFTIVEFVGTSHYQEFEDYCGSHSSQTQSCSCEEDYEDCNSDCTGGDQDGCEVYLVDNSENCGACNIQCDDDDCCTDDKCEEGFCQHTDLTPEVCADVTCPEGEHCICQDCDPDCVPDVPEFPLGVEAATTIGLTVVVVYIWLRKRKTKPTVAKRFTTKTPNLDSCTSLAY